MSRSFTAVDLAVLGAITGERPCHRFGPKSSPDRTMLSPRIRAGR